MESVKHWKGKILLQKILLEDNYKIVLDEVVLRKIETTLGSREYIIDILAFKEIWIAFEIDGYKGHSTKKDLEKMKFRDIELLKRGIKTVRLSLFDLIGNKKQEISLILREIAYQLERQETVELSSDILPPRCQGEMMNMKTEAFTIVQ